jgi:phospholipid-binding lipoprotein MlaA
MPTTPSIEEPAMNFRYLAIPMLALAMTACAGSPVAKPSPVVPVAITAQPQPATPVEPIAEPDTSPVVVTTTELPTAPTQAEQDASALYADTAVRDPWEHYNRAMYRFNNGADKVLFRPLAIAYDTVTPGPVKTGVRNFFGNLGQPGTAVNQVMQGRPLKALQSLGRFAVNTTVGIGGLFDPATRFGMPKYEEDFGQVLARWGWHNSRYFVMPLLGPGTVRDTFSRFGDQQLSPISYVDNVRVANSLRGLQLVDGRARALPMDPMRRDAPDEYAFVRDAWAQRRQHQIDDTP